MIIILLGPPGAGKGTQAKIIEDRFSLKQLSTGDMLRSEIAAGSALGEKVKAILASGELVSDDVIIALIAGRMAKPDCSAGVILDGFPRTVAQAEALDQMLVEKDKPLPIVIELKVDETILVDRIRKRIAEGSARSDDNEETLKHRLNVYREQTAPITPYYARQGLHFSVDGMAPIDAVTKAIESIIRERAAA